MKDTQIYLTHQDEKFKLDVPSNLELNLTFQAGDIRKVLSRNSSFSKTVSFNGSANNNIAFNNIFDVSNDSKFNPNKKSLVQVFTNGQQIFSGYLKLDSIKNTDGLIEYNCTLYSDVSNLFDDLGNMKLNQLDFSEYTHLYNKNSVTGSWETFIYKNGNQIPMQYGQGYVYPYINWGIGGGFGGFADRNYVTTEFFRPALYAKTIVDKIFETAGYSYQSDFFNSNYFKSLIITQAGASAFIDEKVLEASKAKATGTNKIVGIYENDHIQTYHQINWGLEEDRCDFSDDYSQGNYDNGGNFNIVSGEYIVPVTGVYSISSNVLLNTSVDFQELASGSTFNLGTDMHVKGKLIYYSQVCIERNGVEVRLPNLSYSTESEIDGHWHTNGDFINSEAIECPVDDGGIRLEAGDKVYIKAGFSIDKTRFWYPLLPIKKHVIVRTYQIYPSTLQVELNNTPLYPNNLQTFTKFLTEDKCKDFILSIAKMFNLFFTIDADNPKLLNIEPRAEFYDGNVIDWNYKLNRKQEVEITPINEFESRKIILTYKDDSDFYNSEYQKKYNDEVYSTYTYESNENEFISADSDERLDVIFSAAPLNKSKDRITTSIFNKDTDTGQISFNNKSKLRILFYNGLIDCPEYNFIDGGLWISILGTNQTLTKYAYAGMLDNPNNPSESLEFGYPKSYLYERGAITNSNIYYKWWNKFLTDSFNPDNKMLSGYFYLTETDIANLNFRNIIYLNSRYWVVNKVIDYNPINDSLTKVELVMLLNYEQTSTNIDAYQQKINLNTGKHRMANAEIGGYNAADIPFVGNYNTDKGIDNHISVTSSSVAVFGNQNRIGSLATGVGVFGSKNGIVGGTEKSLLIGNDNLVTSPLSSALVVGSGLSGNMLSNAINTNVLNLVPDNNGNIGQIMVNGSPLASVMLSAQTTGATTYTFSGFTQLNDNTGSVSIIDGYVSGFAPLTYNSYGAKIYGVFKLASGGTSGATVIQIGKTDLNEKTDFSNATSDLYTDGVDIFLEVTGNISETITWNTQYKQIIN